MIESFPPIPDASIGLRFLEVVPKIPGDVGNFLMFETRRRILIVDDDPDIHQVLSLCLGDEYDLTAVTSGEEAVSLARSEIFPVVILDLNLSGICGIQTLRALKEINEFQSVILLTGRDTKESAIDAVNYGAYKYVTKPFRLPSFKRLIEDGFVRYEHETKAFALRIGDPSELAAIGIVGRAAEVAFWVIRGESNPEIARRLEISPRTVEKHLQSVYALLGIGNRAKLVPKIQELYART